MGIDCAFERLCVTIAPPSRIDAMLDKWVCGKGTMNGDSWQERNDAETFRGDLSQMALSLLPLMGFNHIVTKVHKKADPKEKPVDRASCQAISLLL